jgi:MoxR-like ATPase
MKTCGWKTPATGIKECTNPRWKEGATYCASHEDEYRQMRRSGAGTRVSRTVSTPAPMELPKLGEIKAVEGRVHSYVVAPELRALWSAAVIGATKRPAGNFLFIGPSGSGKTDGAEELAAASGLDFTKTDAASMTDPEAWFGTREIVVQDGVAVTDYKPSSFIESIQRPGVTFIDEINRCRDEGRNILIPVLDHTRAVLNPLTGEIVQRHPQNFIIMAGNVGLAFTGTSAIDPAFWNRATVVEFEYLSEAEERKVVEDASGCDSDTAFVFARFAADSRARAVSDDEFPAIATRELITAAQHVADGLQRDLAVKFDILNHVSNEGRSASLRGELESIWNGVRAVKPEKVVDPATGKSTINVSIATWTCPTHNQVKVVPAGTSAKTGRPYPAFKACPVYGCPNTESNSQAPASAQAKAGPVVLCPDCNEPQPSGRSVICVKCGAALI